MGLLQNIDLLSVSVVLAGIVILGFTVYFNNRKSITNTSFLYLAIFISAWSALNYASYKVFDAGQIIWILRGVVFSAIWFAFFIFTFFYVFPKEKINFPKWYKYLLVPIVVVVSFLTFTPLVFEQIDTLSATGGALTVTNGPAIFVFGILVFFLDGGAFLLLLVKTIKATKEERKPYRTILYGVIITLSLLLTFNFIFPAFLNNPNIIPYGAFFVFPFVALAAYATYKQKLLNLSNILYGLLAFFIPLILAVEFVFVSNVSLMVIIGTAFIISLVVGIKFIRDIFKLEELAGELSVSNKKQEDLLHVMNHDVKKPLARDISIFANILDGTYGAIPSEMKGIVEEGLKLTRADTQGFIDYLNNANLKTGEVKYEEKPFDVRHAIETATQSMKKELDDANVKLESKIENGSFIIKGDEEKFVIHVLDNLLRNLAKYAKNATAILSLARHGDKILVTLKDTGVGMSSVTMARLFTKGGKGEHSTEINKESTGEGLYDAKVVTENHDGRIWAESAGPGKGSTFFVELPASKTND